MLVFFFLLSCLKEDNKLFICFPVNLSIWRRYNILKVTSQYQYDDINWQIFYALEVDHLLKV